MIITSQVYVDNFKNRKRYRSIKKRRKGHFHNEKCIVRVADKYLVSVVMTALKLNRLSLLEDATRARLLMVHQLFKGLAL